MDVLALSWLASWITDNSFLPVVNISAKQADQQWIVLFCSWNGTEHIAGANI